MPDSVVEESRWRASVRRHFVAMVVAAMIIAGISAGAAAASFWTGITYRQCVADYVQAAGLAQGPRAKFSVAQSRALHAWIKDMDPADRQRYLDSYDAYAQAVKDHPLPPLPGCLR